MFCLISKAGRLYEIESFCQNFFIKIFVYLWWAWLGLNQRPIGYEPTALTTELQALKLFL